MKVPVQLVIRVSHRENYLIFLQLRETTQRGQIKNNLILGKGSETYSVFKKMVSHTSGILSLHQNKYKKISYEGLS